MIIFWPCVKQEPQYYEAIHNIYGNYNSNFGVFITKITNDCNLIDDKIVLLGQVHKDSIKIKNDKLKLDINTSFSSENLVFYDSEKFNIHYISKTSCGFIQSKSDLISKSDDLFICLSIASSISSNYKSKNSEFCDSAIKILSCISHVANILNIYKLPILNKTSTFIHLSSILSDIRSINPKLDGITSEKDIKNKLKLQEQFYSKCSFYLADLALGIALFTLFFFYGIFIVNFFQGILYKYQKIFIDLFIDDIAFALKPNPNLSIFIGNIFMSILIVFKFIFTLLLKLSPLLKQIWIYSFLLGFTFQYSVLKDIFFLSTIHFRYCYTISNSLFRKTFHTLVPLLDLIRGKKRNILTNKIENETYKHDELYLGAILFIIIGCLFYTITFYYLICVFLIGPIYLFEKSLDLMYKMYKSLLDEIVNNKCRIIKLDVEIVGGKVLKKISRFF